MTDLIINSLNNENNDEEDINNKAILMHIEDDLFIKDKTKKQKEDYNEIKTNLGDNSNKIINYNPNSFISLSLNKNKDITLSKTDKIIIEYSQIKANFNKIVEYFNNIKSKPYKSKDKYIKKLSEYNMTLLNYLGELSILLNKILDNPKLYSNINLLNSEDIHQKSRFIFINNNQILENSEKILLLYEKQYNKINDRLNKIKSDEYIANLKSNISNINEEINKYEKENIELKKGQIIFENSLKNKISGKSPDSMDINIQKKLDICKKIELEFIKTSKRIENNKEEIQNNSEKINILNEKCQNLKKMAKDIYDIKQFEAVEKIKQKSKEKKEKIQRKIREYEINVHSMQSGLNKLRTKLEQNKRNIEILEEEKNILIEKYKDKQIEFEKVKNKIIGYNAIKINGKQLNYEDNSTNNSRNNYNIKNIKLNINIEESPKVYELIEEHKNINNKRNNQVLNSSGPSVISLTKEKSNFGDINDIQLLNPIENPKENDNNEKEKGKKNFQVNQIDKDININIIGEKNKKNQSNEINKKEQGKTKIINNNDKTLSKEMILKGLDSQEKTDNILIYSSRNIQNKNNKGTIDRRNFLKLNFSFTSPSKDNRLNRSLNTLPNERNMLNYEIEEDIVLDSNSANNVNINSKEKRFNTKIEDIKISQDKIDNNLKNNTSIEIDKNFVKNEYDNQEKESYGKKEEKYEKDNDKRENVLNTILYNEVDNKTKNEKFMENLNNNNENNLNNEEEQINKSFEEEHIFDKKENEDNNKKEDEKENEKKKEKEKEETDSVNYDFEDGDNIIEVDYEKI